ncbi:unnamed protein product, partial [Staurois parvus]
CLSVSPISATYQKPISATYQCRQSVPPNSARQCRLTVLPISAIYQCCLSVPIMKEKNHLFTKCYNKNFF